jgi:hypothetical protein
MLTEIDQAVIDNLTPENRDSALKSCERIMDAVEKQQAIVAQWKTPKQPTDNQLNQQ